MANRGEQTVRTVTGSGGRLHFGMAAGIKSERRPRSNRNGGRDQIGIPGRIASEFAASGGSYAAVELVGDLDLSWRIAREERRALIRRGEDEHSLQIPGGGYEAPLAACVFEPTRRNLMESERGLDDAEYGFRGLFVQGVERSAFGCFQFMGHRLDRFRFLRGGRRRLEALAQRRMMRLAGHRDRRLDVGLSTSVHIARTEIARV